MTMTITHYGVASLRFCGYFVDGLAAQARLGRIRFRIERRLPKQFAQILADMRKHLGFSLYRVEAHGRLLHIAIDAQDWAQDIHRPLLELVDGYLKVNFDRSVIQGDPLLQAHAHKFFPCLPFFPVAVNRWRHRPRLLTNEYWNGERLRQHVSQLRHSARLDTLTQLRGQPKTHDIVFVVPFYNKGTHQDYNDYRYEVMRYVSEMKSFSSVVGFVGNGIPAPYSEFHLPRVTMVEHLARTAGAKLGLYVHGVHGCISFKFGELLAIGLPIAGQKIPDHFQEQFCAESPRSLVDNAAALLTQSQKLTYLASNNARVFDEALSPTAVGADIVNTIQRMLA